MSLKNCVERKKKRGRRERGPVYIVKEGGDCRLGGVLSQVHNSLLRCHVISQGNPGEACSRRGWEEREGGRRGGRTDKPKDYSAVLTIAI